MQLLAYINALKRSFIILSLLLALVLGGITVVIRNNAGTQEVVVYESVPTELQRGRSTPPPDLWARLREIASQSATYVRNRLLGPPKRVSVGALLFHVDPSSQSTVASLRSLRDQPVTVGTNGFEIWILRPKLFDLVWTELRTNSSVIIDDEGPDGWGRSKTVATKGGPATYGTTFDSNARIHGNAVDVTSVLVTTSPSIDLPADSFEFANNESISIKTNLFLASRLQIPNDSGAFFLRAVTNGSNATLHGVVIHATIFNN